MFDSGVVLFAIKSAIRFGQQIRQAYVDSTKRRELVLPLPAFPDAPTVSTALNWFRGDGMPYAKESSEVVALLSKHDANTITEDEKPTLVTLYKECYAKDLARRGILALDTNGPFLTVDELNVCLTIRQWQRGTDPNPSVLQRLAGTFVEIGTDYFAHVPGALNDGSARCKALAGFLDAMSAIPFSEVPSGDIPVRMFTATLESLDQNPALVSGDAKVQELVKIAAQGLTRDVAKRVSQIRSSGADLVKEQRVGEWAELVFRSLLSSVGNEVMSKPARYLGVKGTGQEELVSNVGGAVLGLVLDAPGLSLDRVFSRQGVETVIKSALKVIGEHPEIIVRSKNVGLQTLLSQVAKDLGQYEQLLVPDLVPELARMILERTSENLDLLWPDLAQRPGYNLLLEVTKTTLDLLSQRPAAGQKWSPRFGRAEVLKVVDTVLGEVVAHPGWLLDGAGSVNPNLKAVLAAALQVLGAKADTRLSPSVWAEVLCEAVKAVALRQEFLVDLPGQAGQDARPVIARVLDLMLSHLLGAQGTGGQWQLLRSDVVLGVVRTAFGLLSRSKLDAAAMAGLEKVLTQHLGIVVDGQPFDLSGIEKDLRAALGIA